MHTIRLFRYYLLAVLALFFVLGSAEAEHLKVGFIGGFSGPGKPYGDACRNGFEMALAEIPNSLKVIYEDDQFIPAKTVAAFKKLINIEKIDVAIVLGSSPANAIAELAEQAKIPLLAWASDSKVSEERAFVIRSYVSGKEEGMALAQEASRRKMAKVAFINTADHYSQSVRQGFSESFVGELALLEEFPPDYLDFRPLLLKLKSREIDALGSCITVGQPAALARQATELGMQLALFGCETLHNMEEIKNARGSLTGSWFVTINIKDSFRQLYLDRYKNEDLISGAAIHYELAKLLAESARQGVITRDGVLKQLKGFGTRDGAVGTYSIRCKEAQSCDFSLGLVIKQVQGDDFKVIRSGAVNL